MALLNPETLRAQFEAFSKLTVLRQLGLMVGLAASVAIGTAIVLWSQQPNYGLLFGGLSGKDAGAVTAALQRANIPYRVDPNSGAIMVPSTQVYNARIKLATEGLPKGTSSSFDLLAKNQGAFGMSQFMETVQYHQALQTELERTIASIDSVQSDRVHLAIPKQSVFIQDSPKPSASVLVNLYSGRNLSAEQIAGIVHLVASSVPGLSTQNVTVVDQQGNLLTGSNGTAAQQSGSSLSSAQYDLTRRLDRLYARRISDILAPIVGANGVRAQVTTSLDYSLINTTSEKYDPNSQVVRSEQTTDNRNWGTVANGAVPGALTNQPPPAGVPAAQSAESTPVAAGRQERYAQLRDQSYDPAYPAGARRGETPVRRRGRELPDHQGCPGQGSEQSPYSAADDQHHQSREGGRRLRCCAWRYGQRDQCAVQTGGRGACDG